MTLMANYTNRTCYECGIKLPQPDMVRKEISYNSGSSNTGLANRTIFGAFIGDKRAGSSVGKWLFSPNKRVYKRKRTVWMCKSCAGEGGVLSSIGSLILWIFIIAIVVGFFK
jgi:hypothetical protein